MSILSFPAFGETNYTDCRFNARCRVLSFPDVTAEAFERYCEALLQDGFTRAEATDSPALRYAAFAKGGDAAFLCYYPRTGELRIELEEDCRYFAFSDHPLETVVTPQLTQLHLEDFGMSYALRLSDGRFLLIDGGDWFVPDADRLFQLLKDSSPHEKPIVAAWILTHPHNDHYLAFNRLMERHGDEIVLEKVMLYFPEHDDSTHFPELLCTWGDRGDNSAVTTLPETWSHIRKAEAAVYTPRTGQRYTVGDAVMEILSSPDDTVHLSSSFNAASLVIRMEILGQVILWCADSPFSMARLPERYGDYLKADILQLPHHGFGAGTTEGQIAAYDLILPAVCLMPASEYNVYSKFCVFETGTRYLMQMPTLCELIDGTRQRTVNLPYVPQAAAREKHLRSYRAGLATNGCETWFFAELSTARDEDFRFTLINSTNQNATVYADLLFEEESREVRYLKTKVQSNSIRRIHLLGPEMDGDALHFNWLSLKEQGVPENAPFAVRFLSDVPLVISHKDHAAAYHAPGGML